MTTIAFHRAAAMLLMSLLSCGALAAAAPAAPAAPPARRALVPDDIYKMESVSDPQISPDGQWVAYLVTTNDRAADEQRSAVWMVSWDGAQRVQLTNPAGGISSPRWSRDGHYLAYLAKPADAEHSQIMLLDRRGGEPRALTRTSDDILGFDWSPDGRRMVLAVQASGEPPEPAEHAEPAAPAAREPGARHGASAKPPKPIVIDTLFFKQDITGYLGSGHEQHLYLLEVANGRLEPLEHDAGSNSIAPAWSPDGRRIAFTRTKEKGADPDGTMDLEIIEARPGAMARRLAHLYIPNEQHLAWSPDSRLVAYQQGQEPRYNSYMQDQLVVVSADGGAPRVLTAQLDRAVAAYAFSADGAAITLAIEDDRSQYPARLDLAHGTVEKLVTDPISVAALSGAGAHLAMVASTDTTAAEVYALEPTGPRRLTQHGDALLGEVQLGAVEDISFRSRDGTEVHGMMVKPPGYEAGRRYPTVLWIHGGPDGQDDHSADFDSYQFRRQLVAADGYVVLGVNYRGSSGRGAAYSRAILADWGHKEVEDLLAGIDDLVARGIADPARLGIGGWSYGGILSDYTIASDQRFKAAISGAGSALQLSMYGTDQYFLAYKYEIGPPWRNAALWMKLSYPFFHADRIRTPTLFMGGDKDFNVPIAGGEQMYQALRTLGVPARLVVYPDQYHSLTRPSFIKDRLERVADWYRQYLPPQQ
jgi:dipeptidyl aminopeptidase/acylaminoacyl peptidase